MFPVFAAVAITSSAIDATSGAGAAGKYRRLSTTVHGASTTLGALWQPFLDAAQPDGSISSLLSSSKFLVIVQMCTELFPMDERASAAQFARALLMRPDLKEGGRLGSTAAAAMLQSEGNSRAGGESEKQLSLRVDSGLGSFGAGSVLFSLVNLLESTEGRVELDVSNSGLEDDGLAGCCSIVAAQGAEGFAQLTSLKLNEAGITSEN